MICNRCGRVLGHGPCVCGDLTQYTFGRRVEPAEPVTVDLKEALTWLKRRCSSVLLNWGEDTDNWECSFISAGERYTAISLLPDTAVNMAVKRWKELEKEARK
jgi:hypothetical protein